MRSWRRYWRVSIGVHWRVHASFVWRRRPDSMTPSVAIRSPWYIQPWTMCGCVRRMSRASVATGHGLGGHGPIASSVTEIPAPRSRLAYAPPGMRLATACVTSARNRDVTRDESMRSAPPSPREVMTWRTRVTGVS